MDRLSPEGAGGATRSRLLHLFDTGAADGAVNWPARAGLMAAILLSVVSACVITLPDLDASGRFACRVATAVAGIMFLMEYFWRIWRAPILNPDQVGSEPGRWSSDCVPVRSITRHFSLWAMAVGHITNNYPFYFLLAWLPLFLVQQRGFSIEQMSYLATLSYAAQAVAALSVGWASDRYCKGGTREASTRRNLLVAAQMLGAVAVIGILMSGTESMPWLMFWLVMAGISGGIGSVNLFAVAQMFAGPRASGTWVGVQNAIGNTSGIVGPIVTGMIIDWSGSYAGAFWLTAAVSASGALWWAFALPPIRLVELD